jgi:large subunit ribosomal protein L35
MATGKKLKSHSGTRKRFKKTGSGKILRHKAGRRHILTSKARDRKRRLKGKAVVDQTMESVVKRLLPYE